MFTQRVVAGTLIVALAIVINQPEPEAAKPTPNPRCGVQFADRGADRVRSDNGTPYLDGYDAVECQVWTGGSEDVTLRLPSKSTSRRFTVDFTSLAGAGQVPNPPARVSTDGWFLNIRQVGTMPVGTTITTQATVQAESGSLIFRWCGGAVGPCTFGGIDPGSFLVAATRHAGGWSVTTDPSEAAPQAGDVAVLYQQVRPNSYRPVASYHLPFALEISCPTCPAP